MVNIICNELTLELRWTEKIKRAITSATSTMLNMSLRLVPDIATGGGGAGWSSAAFGAVSGCAGTSIGGGADDGYSSCGANGSDLDLLVSRVLALSPPQITS